MQVLWLLPLLLTMAIVPLSLVGLDRPVGDVMDGLGKRARNFAESALSIAARNDQRIELWKESGVKSLKGARGIP